jgi:hypothetical protein
MRVALACALAASFGCGDAEVPVGGGEGGVAPTGLCAAGEVVMPDGSCVAAGMQPNGCAAGETWSEELGCVAAGMTASGCAPGEVSLESGCTPAGVPSDGCATGFVSDSNGGCNAVLPRAPCGPGEHALLGETSCHAVAPCGSGTWGDIPVDATTLYVDASAPGGGDGSLDTPFVTIQAAIDAAAPNGLIAIAAGSYAEDLLISGKPVKLWGKCPAEVEVIGSTAAITVESGVQGAEVHALGITSAGTGVVIGGDASYLGQLWIHDTGGPGIDVPGISAVSETLVEGAHEYGIYIAGGVAMVGDTTVRGTLPGPDHGWGMSIQIDEDSLAIAQGHVAHSVIESNTEVGLLAHASWATLSGTLVRDTLPNASGRFGRGIVIQTQSPHPPAFAALEGVVVERARDAGIMVAGSWAGIGNTVVRDVSTNLDVGDRGNGIGAQPDPGAPYDPSLTIAINLSLVERASEHGVLLSGVDATLSGVLVRDTQPIDDGTFGRGLSIQYDPITGRRSNVEAMDECRIEGNHDVGLVVVGADALIWDTLVRDTRPRVIDGEGGFGLVIQNWPETDVSADATVWSSIVEESVGHGIFVAGAHASIEGTVVRTVTPGFGTNGGRGINIQDNPVSGLRSTAEVKGTVIEHAHEAGVSLGGADATLEGIVVRDILPATSGIAGRGVNVQTDMATGERSNAILRWSVIERTHDVGVFVADADMTVEGTVIREVQARTLDGLFGDGVAVMNLGGGSSATITGARIEDAVRAGVAVFGSATALGQSRIGCNLVDLVGNDFSGAPVALDNLGGNECGCDQPKACKVLASELEPPQPVGP